MQVLHFFPHAEKQQDLKVDLSHRAFSQVSFTDKENSLAIWRHHLLPLELRRPGSKTLSENIQILIDGHLEIIFHSQITMLLLGLKVICSFLLFLL